ncbi:MAG: tyrosine-protein phosphatase [Dehalococcoidia bacterium]|nr:MAG: tyrosine-protein phosphatase [Dehalococcoidia bacterium]
MGIEESSRNFNIDFAGNMRDLGGYRTVDDRRVAWKRLFRSGELRHKSEEDVALLKRKTGLVSVLDLRGDTEVSAESAKFLTTGGIQYKNIPLMRGESLPDPDAQLEVINHFTNMGEFYLYFMDNENFGKKMVLALEFIADKTNQPVLFHCTAGKDRTGILSAAILSVLGVADEDIITDYNMTTPHMAEFLERKKLEKSELPNMPAFFHEASRESMKLLLSEIRQKYSSFSNYLVRHNCRESLFEQLESAFLEKD